MIPCRLPCGPMPRKLASWFLWQRVPPNPDTKDSLVPEFFLLGTSSSLTTNSNAYLPKDRLDQVPTRIRAKANKRRFYPTNQGTTHPPLQSMKIPYEGPLRIEDHWPKVTQSTVHVHALTAILSLSPERGTVERVTPTLTSFLSHGYSEMSAARH
ncbi:uncharacterized protein BO66DRAFT_203229 [Aspergillus aculeatinus CBS 121060]|uniref:Uncharacterized protein n=1 Tax=Aspergillus aculeatinus CBS 121060 TaxID=1448322 RepID=A0ACD1HJ70_9EURO|nr:hypothetical protein BO66DRAFT_203229 [Aspergillus aculeatinus CBS 121060]RAH73668.1 hypothetical protein BO66DRAFT_203229 [Aspergillus aculeatinus CBS 121060]